MRLKSTGPDHRKKSADWTALETLIQEESHTDGKDSTLGPWKALATLFWESTC